MTYLSFEGFVLLIFGVSTILKSDRYTLLIFYIIGAVINGFNAFEWKFIGTDRILLPYYSFLWIISAIALTKAGDARIKVTPDRYITVPKRLWILFILLYRVLHEIVYLS